VSSVRVRLVHAPSPQLQQAALDRWLNDARSGAADERQRALVVEGPSFALQVPVTLAVQRLAAGCVCCVGQVPLRVALTRSLRGMAADQPRAVLLLIAQGEHLPRLAAQIERGELGQGITVEQAV
jgi:hypothetical protein